MSRRFADILNGIRHDRFGRLQEIKGLLDVLALAIKGSNATSTRQGTLPPNRSMAPT